METDFYLIRHGEVNYPLDRTGRKLVYGPETLLAKLGEIQLEDLADQFFKEKIPVQIIFSSPFTRAKQSADIFKEKLSIKELIILDELKDVWPNSFEGQPLEEYFKINGGDIYSHPLSSNQESLEHLVERARTARKLITETVHDKYTKVAIVSHGDLLSAFDWGLKREESPVSYEKMKKSFYLQKGQAIHYRVGPEGQLVDEGRLITVETVKKSVEKYR